MTAGIRCADHATPSIRKSWHYFANKWRSLGRYSSLADQSHGVKFLVFNGRKRNETVLKDMNILQHVGGITSQPNDTDEFWGDMHKLWHGNVATPSCNDYRRLIALFMPPLHSTLTSVEHTSCFVGSLQVSAGHNDSGPSPGEIMGCLFTNTCDKEGTLC
jgi:hypothetical protein